MVLALLFFLLAGLASAQTGEDARALLQEIASSSRDAKSWLAEGVEVGELSGRGMQIHDESRFKVAYQSPSKMLWETNTTKETNGGIDTGVLTGGLIVCDGTDHWAHYWPSTSFYRSSIGVSSCKPEMGDFSKIGDNLVSAARVGRDRVQFGNASTECELVRAEYAVPTADRSSSGTAGSIRTFCIDPVRKLILRDRAEARIASSVASTKVTTYTRYERDTNLPVDLFQFQVPTGYFLDEGPQPDLIVENGVYRLGMPISSPTLISKLEPSYTEEALQAGVSGIVLVSFNVSPDGVLDKVKVVRGLGHGLDEKAVEAVRKWQFRPGTKDGVPVAVGPLAVAVSFRQP